MTDLTKITTPYGLLDAETQKALREHGGPYEMFFTEGWRTGDPIWSGACTYRVKPQPPKPREVWINEYPTIGLNLAWHPSQKEADRNKTPECLRTIRFVEAIE